MKRFASVPVGLMILAAVGSLRADEPPAPPPHTEDAAVNQEILAQQFRAFEQSLLRLAQRLENSKKPEERERAATLKKAIAMANGKLVDNKFEKLIQILKASKALSLQELREAMEQNRMVADDIKNILALLLADNRDAQLKSDRERIANLLKQLDLVIKQQKQVRARTEAGKTDKDTLAKEQAKVTGNTEKLARAMEKKDKAGQTESKNGEPKKGGDQKSDKDQKGDGKGKPQDQKGGKEKPDKDQKSDGKGKPQDQDQKGGGKGKPGESQESKKGGEPSENGSQPEPTPGKKQVQQATQHQKQAEKNINEEKPGEASSQQDKAITELEKARKRLEEILRQLREEEIERILADLQQRCQRMLQMQIEVQEGTVRVERAVNEAPDKKPTRSLEQRALQLSDREERIVDEANKAIQILEAEGSAVAFPEVFTQVRDDMGHVARRLGKADVGSVTQVIEQDIINTLKEMIDALKKAQQKLQASKNQPPSGSGDQDQRLIDILAELKMIRAMQIRVNSRTQVYGQRYTGEQASESDIQKELGNLAQRQEKIFEITNNIYRGNNR